MLKQLERRLLKICGHLLAAALAAAPGYAQPVLVSGSTSFPVQYVGAPISQTLTYSFSQPYFLFTPLVLTGGVTGGDFQLTGGNCVTGNFGAGQSCFVQVTFTPSAPGLRMGAVLFPGPGNTVAAVTYLWGVGWGPLPALSPGLTTYSPPLTPTSVAVDGGGTVYLGGQGMDNGALTYGLWNLAGNMFATQAFAEARAIVIDGAGYSYVSDPPNQCIWQTTPILPSIAPATVCLSLPAAWTHSFFMGPLAVDGYGDVYASGMGECLSYNPYPYCQDIPYVVFKYTPSTRNWTVATDLESGALATDGAGNLYIAHGYVYKVPPNTLEDRSQWIKIWSEWDASSVAVDGEGTVFVLDGHNQLWKVPQGPWPYSNLQPPQLINTASLGLGNWIPGYIAMDGAGNAYVTDSTNQKVYKLGGANFIGTTVTTDGVCGSANGSTVTVAPAANLCSTGTASAVTGTGPWTWACAGTNGGQTASCSASAPATPLNGSCGPSNGQNFTAAPAAGLCVVGTPLPVPVAGSGPWTWTCVGLNGGANSPLCSAALSPSGAVNGACNTALTSGTLGAAPSGNLCSAGTASAVTGSGPWNWTCTGFNGGATASCSAQPASSACASGTVTLLPKGGIPVRLGAQDSVYYGDAWIGSQQQAVMNWSGGSWQVAITPPPGTYINWFGFDAAGNAYLLYSYTTELHVFNPAGKEISSLTIGGIINYYGASRLAVDRAGNAYVSSTDSAHGHQVVKKITPAGVVTTIMGLYGGWGCSAETDSLGDGCPASQVDLVSSDPIPMTVDAAGNLYFAHDSSSQSGVTKNVTAWVRKIDATTGIVTLVAGGSLAQENQSTITAFESGDGGPAIGAAFLAPKDLAVDFRGNLYLADGYYVRKVDAATGIIQTVTTPGVSHTLAYPEGPVSIAVSSGGDLYVGGEETQGNFVGIYVYAGVTGGNCVTATAVAAACGTANHTIVVSPATAASLCAPGSFPSGVASSGGSLSWTCFSLSNGSPASCSGTAPPQLTVTANNNSMIQGNPLPSPLATVSYSGFWNGEGWWVLAGAPSLATTATSSSPPGNYPITIAQGTLDSGGRYTFTFVPGTLSVLAPPKVQLSSAASFSKISNGYQAVVTVTNTGGADANSLVLSSATLGTAAGSPLPQTQAKAAAGGGSATFTVTFPLSAGADGASVPAKFSGTYNGGSFSLNLRSVTLP